MIATHPFGKTFFGRIVLASLAASLLLLPASQTARASRLRAFIALPQDVQAQSEADEARREREQEQREREREQDRLDHLQELYDDGREALDDDHYEQAVKKFTELAQMNGPQTDAALYWKAYAENKLGKKAAALATIAEVKSKYAQSRWKKDAEALELEVKQSSGQKPNPDAEPDKDLKAMALRALWQSDAERALPITEKILNGSDSPKYKANVLFVAAQSGSSQAMELLTKTARGQSNPELQRKAIEYLSMFGSDRAHKTLSEVYGSSNDESVKRQIIRSYLLSGDKASLFAAAKNEKNELQAFFLAGDSKRMEQAALNEKDIELRRSAIRNLGLMGHSDLLQSIYAKETDRSLKEEVLNAYFISGNAKGLVAIARAEKDPGLKKKAVEKLSHMGSKEGNDYLMEILEK